VLPSSTLFTADSLPLNLLEEGEYIFFYKTSYVDKESNRTETFNELSIPGTLSKRFHQMERILTESGIPVHHTNGFRILTKEELVTMFIKNLLP